MYFLNNFNRKLHAFFLSILLCSSFINGGAMRYNSINTSNRPMAERLYNPRGDNDAPLNNIVYTEQQLDEELDRLANEFNTYINEHPEFFRVTVSAKEREPLDLIDISDDYQDSLESLNFSSDIIKNSNSNSFSLLTSLSSYSPLLLMASGLSISACILKKCFKYNK